MKNKTYLIYFLNSSDRAIRKSLLHPLEFVLKGIISRLKSINDGSNSTDKIIKKGNKIKASFKFFEYIGTLKNNKPHGKGLIRGYDDSKFICGRYSYEGNFVNGIANGKGIEKNLPEDLGSYSGDFKNNRRHGNGTFTFFNGSKYIGQWKNNFRNGKGSYIWPDGHKLEGKWSGDIYTNFDDVNSLYPLSLPLSIVDFKSFAGVRLAVSDSKKNSTNPKLIKNGISYKMISFDEINLRKEKKLSLKSFVY